jgi:nitrogen regulatory protein P-II 1
MKKLEAIVGRADLDVVKQDLAAAGVRSFVASEAICMGASLCERRVYRGSTYAADVGGCLRLEVVVSDDRLAEVLNVLRAAAERGPALDGAVLVFSVEQALSRANDLPDDGGRIAVDRAKAATPREVRAPRAVESAHPLSLRSPALLGEPSAG